jgi:coenzyme F420-reducing hydrogenase delta subunit
MCSGRVSPLWILRCFQQGADGVFVGGCHPGECHYREGNYYQRRRLWLLRSLLEYVGINPTRLRVAWISASESQKFATVVKDLVEEIRALGPLEKLRRRVEW